MDRDCRAGRLHSNKVVYEPKFALSADAKN